MSRVPTAVQGNRLSIIAMILAILVAFSGGSLTAILVACLFLLLGGAIGLVLARKVTMIQMPQTVGLLNGLGGAASALVGIVTLGVTSVSASIVGFFQQPTFHFEAFTAVLAIVIGMVTLTGSLVAAGKLHRVLKQQPVILPFHSLIMLGLLVLSLVMLIWGGWFLNTDNFIWIALLTVVVSGLFGWIFTIRVGGADMPITISLLNSLSGVAGGIAGMAIGNVMLVAIGGIVGASGLLLTQVMCKAMNRSLLDILLGKTSAPTQAKKSSTPPPTPNAVPQASKESTLSEEMKAAKSVIIVPGYGMALAQAQHQ
ncbi:NAD(P)(+) transhydrogenase (Re/Si-specific) subunit beta, partial [Porphyromonas sp. HMSC077F02]|uniref:NAD(P)(+) transhydrogenase (Re/Si-specific) subunit beta n=1 Tax=Porphyromonas sp. HMSC077F02 TaxID=1739529 RepID=UPI001FEDC40E